MSYFPIIPCVRATNTADVSCPANTAVYVTWNVNNFDNYSMHSVSTNTSQFVCKVAGKYQITAQFILQANTTYSGSSFRFYVNHAILIATQQGTDYAQPTVVSSESMTMTTFYQLNVGDYVELYVVAQDTASATAAFRASSTMQMSLISL